MPHASCPLSMLHDEWRWIRARSGTVLDDVRGFMKGDSFASGVMRSLVRCTSFSNVQAPAPARREHCSLSFAAPWSWLFTSDPGAGRAFVLTVDFLLSCTKLGCICIPFRQVFQRLGGASAIAATELPQRSPRDGGDEAFLLSLTYGTSFLS